VSRAARCALFIAVVIISVGGIKYWQEDYLAHAIHHQEVRYSSGEHIIQADFFIGDANYDDSFVQGIGHFGTWNASMQSGSGASCNIITREKRRADSFLKILEATSFIIRNDGFIGGSWIERIYNIAINHIVSGATAGIFDCKLDRERKGAIKLARYFDHGRNPGAPGSSHFVKLALHDSELALYRKIGTGSDYDGNDGEDGYPSSGSRGAPSRPILGAFIFLIGFALVKLAYAITDQPTCGWKTLAISLCAWMLAVVIIAQGTALFLGLDILQPYALNLQSR
jgi:hypothetical protein